MLKMWPDAQELRLLRAALGDGDDARQAFADWQSGTDWTGELDGGSFRLLPLVHANLARLGCADPVMGRLRGIYRHSWCEAQGHLRSGAAALATLRTAGIPVIVSKGLLLASHHYDSPALRPMSDVDLLVPADRALDAIAALGTGGWHEDDETHAQWGRRRGDMLALNAGLGVRHQGFGEVDLHWRLLQESAGATTEAAFWHDALPVTIQGVDALRPSPTHLFFHVVTHGLRPNVMSPLRWIPDAAMVLRREAAAIDWDQVLECGRRHRVGRRLARGLAYLAEVIGLPIPSSVAGASAAASWVERIEDRAFRNSTTPARHQRWLDNQAQAARLLVSEGRGHLPRLALRWTARRLIPRLSQP